MEDYHLFFAKVDDFSVLKFYQYFNNDKAAVENWVIDPPTEYRGYTNAGKFLRFFGKKKKDRKKLIVSIIKAAIVAGLGAGGGYVILSEPTGPILFEIHIHNNDITNEINIVSPDRKQSIAIDSSNLEQEIHKIDSLGK